jgi:hypothetical protein
MTLKAQVNIEDPLLLQHDFPLRRDSLPLLLFGFISGALRCSAKHHAVGLRRIAPDLDCSSAKELVTDQKEIIHKLLVAALSDLILF